MSGSRPTSGLSVLECIVALSVLATMLTTVLSIQVVQTTRVRLAKERLVAQQTLANLADRAMTAGYENITAASIQPWLDEAEARTGLPAGTLQVVLESVDQPASGQRIEFTWERSPVLPHYRLVAWRFAPPGESSQDTEEGS